MPKLKESALTFLSACKLSAPSSAGSDEIIHTVNVTHPGFLESDTKSVDLVQRILSDGKSEYYLDTEYVFCLSLL